MNIMSTKLYARGNIPYSHTPYGIPAISIRDQMHTKITLQFSLQYHQKMVRNMTIYIRCHMCKYQ